tara:strand:- start:671 stop:826 length:156 start_codon:yes stop_codon:yes gene_type:complete
LAFILAACEDAPNDPQIKTVALDNVLEIIIITNCCADVVTHIFWYRLGSAD